jgi:hypothetical protein
MSAVLPLVSGMRTSEASPLAPLSFETWGDPS